MIFRLFGVAYRIGREVFEQKYRKYTLTIGVRVEIWYPWNKVYAKPISIHFQMSDLCSYIRPDRDANIVWRDTSSLVSLLHRMTTAIFYSEVETPYSDGYVSTSYDSGDSGIDIAFRKRRLNEITYIRGRYTCERRLWNRNERDIRGKLIIRYWWTSVCTNKKSMLPFSLFLFLFRLFLFGGVLLLLLVTDRIIQSFDVSKWSN